MLPVPLMQALIGALGVEATLALANRFAQGTPTPLDNTIVSSLGYASLVGMALSPVKTTQLGVMGLEAGATLAIKGGKKVKRKASKYNKEFAKQYKAHADKMKLKNGKWRKGCSHKQCMKKAHIATRRALK